MIKRETRRNITDHFDMDGIHFSGRMNDLDFLERLYELKRLPSHDPRYEDAAGDIWQHSVNNNDYEGNWVFSDERFGLLNGSDEVFLKFICDMAHPLVRPDTNEANRILVIANDWLREEGWELYPTREIAGGRILSFRQINAIERPKDDEVALIWDLNKIRFFISHRDRHKADAKKLGNELKKYGISSFVAHDSIQAMSTWKYEIMKALQTMDACLCFITSDFYESEWTNQEVGFALARGIPIYLYSVDKSDPKGFKFDTQAIKSGFSELVNCIKKDFSNNEIFKRSFIDNFIDARDGSFSLAKESFYNLVGMNFNDDEIETIARAIAQNKGKKDPVNKLHAILEDGVEDRHKSHPLLRGYSRYLDYLTINILNVHSKKIFTFKKIDKWEYELVAKDKVR